MKSAYRKIAEVTGSIAANTNDKKKFQEDIAQFNTLFWGTMIFVEDKEVEKAMIAFSLAIRDYQGGWIGVEKLKIDANSLIQACRQSAAKGTPST